MNILWPVGKLKSVLYLVDKLVAEKISVKTELLLADKFTYLGIVIYKDLQKQEKHKLALQT